MLATRAALRVEGPPQPQMNKVIQNLIVVKQTVRLPRWISHHVPRKCRLPGLLPLRSLPGPRHTLVHLRAPWGNQSWKAGGKLSHRLSKTIRWLTVYCWSACQILRRRGSTSSKRKIKDRRRRTQSRPMTSITGMRRAGLWLATSQRRMYWI